MCLGFPLFNFFFSNVLFPSDTSPEYVISKVYKQDRHGGEGMERKMGKMGKREKKTKEERRGISLFLELYLIIKCQLKF